MSKKTEGGSSLFELIADLWQPIETAPKPADWLKYSILARYLVGRWFQPVNELGESSGDGSWAWVQVVSLTSSGWHVWSSFKGWHGTATIPVHDNATHWMPLPSPPRALDQKGSSNG